MEEVKKKRGRPRKTQIQEIVEAHEEKERQEIHQMVLEEKAKRKQWDVQIDEDIEFFDINLSYELTGYRPINNEKGLDFNPDWFTEARDTFKRTGHYTQYKPNTKAYADFWTQEYIRCREGLTVNGYTVTGDHYFFLNYYQLMDLTSAKKAGEGRVYDFPKFFVIQYEWFHYLEMAKKLRLNAALMKARGCGFSEMDAALSANMYNCRRNSVTVIAAALDNYVSKTLEKVWKALSFLNDYTDGGFFKLRQIADTAYHKKASYYKIINGQKVETGWMSQITGIVADKPNKIRGDRTDLLIYEEGGSWPNSTKAFIQGDALTGIQGARFGLKIIGGTGGDSGPALEGLRDIYYNPTEYDVLPFRHSFTQTGEQIISSFFIPASRYINRPEYMDSRGYTDEAAGKEFYNKERDKKAKTPKNLITYSSEYCFNAEEAFALEGDNKFNKVLIAEQLAQIRINKNAPKVHRGELDAVKNSKGKLINLNWIENNSGNIHILEHPVWSDEYAANIQKLKKQYEERNEVFEMPDQYSEMKNLYVAGIDSIDIGTKDTSSLTKDPSDFCIVIKKRAFGNQEPQYVAYYKARPADVRDAYKTAIKLCQYYNCMINIEATRMSMVSWARDNGFIHMFMKRPRATMPDIMRGRSNQYGSPATVAVIDHQTDLISDFVNDYCHTIWFDTMLDELNRYTDENKTKFDMIAAMGLCELADEELHGVTAKEVTQFTSEFQDIGYYVDENGYKKFGVIPASNKPQINYTNVKWTQRDDEIFMRTSRPYGY